MTTYRVEHRPHWGESWRVLVGCASLAEALARLRALTPGRDGDLRITPVDGPATLTVTQDAVGLFGWAIKDGAGVRLARAGFPGRDDALADAQRYVGPNPADRSPARASARGA